MEDITTGINGVQVWKWLLHIRACRKRSELQEEHKQLQKRGSAHISEDDIVIYCIYIYMHVCVCEPRNMRR